MTIATTTKINGKTVTHGDTIITFRDERLTFDYEVDGMIYTKERQHGLVHRVFVDAEPSHDDGA